MVKKRKTNGEAKVVVRATVQFLALIPKVGWVCCSFSPLFQEIFLQVHQFSPLLKTITPNSNARCSLGIVEFCLRRILHKTFSSLWLLFFYSNVEPLSKYSPVMLHLSPATKILNENPETWFGKDNHFQLMSSSELLFHFWTNHNYLK